MTIFTFINKMPIKRLLLIIFFLCIENIVFAFSLKQPVDYVRPQIDSHKSRWFYFSSACRPFGMVSLSPDTWVKGSWNSGYMYDSTAVRCFSHVHCWQIAGVPVMPTTGEVLEYKGMESAKSPFSHANEVVKPGYHKVFLDRYKIGVELTSTSRVGMHRYSYPENEQANVLLDVGAFLAHGSMKSAAIRYVSSTELSGYSVLAPTGRRKKNFTVYYVVQFNKPMTQFGGWEKVKGKYQLSLNKQLEGKEIGGYASFKDLKGKPLLMKVGISYVSEEQARLNVQTELPHWNFDKVVKESRAEWNAELGKIKVEGGTEEQQIKFYTDLWHSLLGRHTFSDVNGKYIDNTGDTSVVRQVPLVHGKPTRNTYNSDGFWGSEFNLNILWSIAYPKMMSEFSSTLIDYYKNGGMIARGPSGGNYTFVMAGDQAIPLIVAAYNKGIRDFDVDAAYKGCLKNSEPGGIRDCIGYNPTPQDCMKHYVEKGYVPEKSGKKAMHQEGCALTLYFAYQDYCMAQFAKAMGNDSDYHKYLNRSFNYRNVFDKQSGWMRPRRADGSWMPNFKPVGKGFNMPGFIESNSAIFSYYVPHDIDALIKLRGGNEPFIAQLNKQFELAAPTKFITKHGAHAQNWVDYENQPSLHLAHLFSYAGAPWLTQYWVRRIKNEVFSDITPYGGYNGDEDQGQMGAWGVLAAIGLFDVQGGVSIAPYYELTSPLFNKITISLDKRYYPGKEVIIETRNNSQENLYIQKVYWNGKIHNSFKLPHAEFIKGGHLVIELGNKPNKQWGHAFLIHKEPE